VTKERYSVSLADEVQTRLAQEGLQPDNVPHLTEKRYIICPELMNNIIILIVQKITSP